ncbi:DUF3718 domain-containing protein [Pseudidiomarina aestuarii]|uniref:DUF3718 domain-containing protein n=1 Tax=Pseudidiomarina aestuarii TaxID=624146 RepID=UPI003A980A5C
MKNWLSRITLAIIILSGGFHIPSHAQQLGVQNVTADTALAICSYVRTNDSRALKQKLQYERKRLRDIYSSIRCNNLSLIQFALQHNAHDVGRFLAISATPDSIIEAGDIEWAKSKNLLDTPTGSLLRERMTCVRQSRAYGAEESCSQLFRSSDSRTQNTPSYLR